MGFKISVIYGSTKWRPTYGQCYVKTLSSSMDQRLVLVIRWYMILTQSAYTVWAATWTIPHALPSTLRVISICMTHGLEAGDLCAMTLVKWAALS